MKSVTIRTMLLMGCAFGHLAMPAIAQAQNHLSPGEEERGLELEARGEVLPGLNATASYTRLFGKIVRSADLTELGKKPATIPNQNASLWLDYTAPEGFGLGLGTNFTGKRPNDEANTTTEPGFWLFNASAHYETGPWRLIVSATKLFDNGYNTICYHGECYRGERRAVVATLRYRM